MNNTTQTIIISLLVGAVGFGGGYFLSGQKNPTGSNLTPAGNNQNRFTGIPGGENNLPGTQRNRMNAGGTFGEILKSDPQSLTIKLPTGGSQIIFYSDSTKLSKSIDATKDELQVGKTVQINGTPSTDGTLAAQSIQLRESLPTPPKSSDILPTPTK